MATVRKPKRKYCRVNKIKAQKVVAALDKYFSSCGEPSEINYPSESILFLLLAFRRTYPGEIVFSEKKFLKALFELQEKMENNSLFFNLLTQFKIHVYGNGFVSKDIDEIFAKLYYENLIFYTSDSKGFEFHIGQKKANEYLKKFTHRLNINASPEDITAIIVVLMSLYK